MADIDAPIKLSQREVVGKGLNRLRSDGTVPAVIHNFGQPSIHVMAPEVELLSVYRAAGKHHPLNLEVGSDKYLALIKDAHFNPVKRKLEHLVFQAIRQDEVVEAEVPIRLEGDAPAERAGLIVLRQLDAVEIEALPKNLPDELVISAESLAELHDKLVVGDLKIPEGVTILTDAEHPIATVAEPRAVAAEEVIEETEAEAGEEGAEGEETETGESETTEKSSDSNEEAINT
jgi:large subunit ribosomal protein L25